MSSGAGSSRPGPLPLDYDENPERLRLARSVLGRYADAPDIHARIASRLREEELTPVLDVGCGDGELATVVITGPPGAGKTAILTALADSLSDDHIPHAAIDIEALVWTHPALSDKQWVRHVASACALYREAGHRLLLAAQTLETDDDVDQLFRAVGADDYFVVRLEAQPATLVERIVQREPAGWSGLDELVEHAQELAATMPALKRIDLVVSTEGERAEDVAARIRAAGPAGLDTRQSRR